MAVPAPTRKKLLTMFSSEDMDVIRQGVELFAALDDDELWHEVLDTASFDDSHVREHGRGKGKTHVEIPGRLVGTSFLKWNTRTTRWDELVLRLLVQRRGKELVDQVTGLDLGGMVTGSKWLPIVTEGLDTFPNLDSLTVFTGSAAVDLASLGSLPGLRRLRIDGNYATGGFVIELPSLPQLEELTVTARRPVRLGDMPNLRTAVIDAPVESPHHLRTVRALTLAERADEQIVDHCPEVTEFTRTRPLRSAIVRVPAGARLVDRSLTLVAPSDIGNVASLVDLQLLVVTPGETPVVRLDSLAECADLRVLDLRGHASVQDLSFLEGHPQLRMVAAHGTRIGEGDIPASMSSIVSLAKSPDLTKALDRPPPGAKSTRRTTSPAVGADTRKVLARLKKLLQSTDMTMIMQGVELAASLDDADVWNVLVDGVTYEEGGQVIDKSGRVTEVVGRLIPNKLFTGTLYRQPWLDVGLAHLVARSPSPLRTQVTDLALGQWSYSTSPLESLAVRGLGGFENLRCLQLLQARRYDLGALDELGELRELRIEGSAEIPSHPRLTRLVVGRGASFADGGRLPELESAVLSAGSDLAPLTASAPKLLELRLVGAGPTHVSGLSTVTTLSATGKVSVSDCPALESLQAGFLEGVGMLPALRTAHIGVLASLDVLAGMPALETLSVQRPIEASVVRVASGPAIDGALRLTGVEDLGNIADLRDLRTLALSNVADDLSLEPLRRATDLRVLDIRGCAGISDLEPIAELSELRLVSARDSGVTAVPADLDLVVSLAKQVDVEAAADGPIPTRAQAASVKSSTGKIPVPESEREAWAEVLAGLATSSPETALAAIDRAAELDPAGLEFLASKVSILRNQLRSRAPFRLSSRVLLPAVVARMLAHIPAESSAAAKFRRMDSLVVDGEHNGVGAVRLDELEQFPAVEQVVIDKCSDVGFESIAGSSISMLAFRGRRIECGALPETLRDVYLEGLYQPDLRPFARPTIKRLFLIAMYQIDLEHLVDSPPGQILMTQPYSDRIKVDIPAALKSRVDFVAHASFRKLL